MTDNETDTSCSICYESREDLRMLPCWHVACLSCILRMSDTGETRAMKCHQCREPFLFENVRSLPQPIKCNSCHQFLRNPKQLNCCSALLCSDCYVRISKDERETVTCPKECTKSRHQLVDVSTPRVCCQCFALHTNSMAGCDHSLCPNCNLALSQAQRPCPLCVAIASPMPIPINPSGRNAAAAGLNNELLDGGQLITQMHLISAMQTVRIWNQRNARQRELVPAASYTAEHFKQDFPKGCAAVLAMLIVIIGWGFTCWLWITMALYFLLLRPRITFITPLVSVINAAFTLYLLYHHFFVTLCYDGLASIWAFGFYRWTSNNGANALKLIIGSSVVWLRLVLAWAFLPPVFFNHAILSSAIFLSIFVAGIANRGM